MPGRNLVAALLWSLSPLLLAAAPAPSEEASADEALLRGAGAAVDGDGLLAFFRRRTLGEAECARIGALIRRLGADDFDQREKATDELCKIGVRAAPLLRAARADPDAEIAHRAGLGLASFGGPDVVVPSAAARLVARRNPDGAVPVLLAFAPFAADETVEDEVFDALLALTPSGKADPALDAALADPSAARRAAAAHVLSRKGDAAERDAVRKRLDDEDASVRWRAALGLVTARDKAAVPALIRLLTDGPSETAWRAEDVLRRLAGDAAPAVASGDAPDARRKRRDAWAAWWKQAGDGVDLARYEDGGRLLGLTLAVEYNTGRVWECDRAGSVRWEIRNLAGPMDAQVLPNGRVLVAESNAHRITERDLKGDVHWEKAIDGDPTGCQRLPDGSTFVSTYCNVMEFAPDGTTTYSFRLETCSNAIRKARNGHVLYTLNDKIVEVDTAGRRVRAVPLPVEPTAGRYVGLEDLPGDRFLVANSNSGRVMEMDAAGKILWETTAPGACGVTRLPDGHTLVGLNRQVVELDAGGRQVWEKAAEGYTRRVHRR